MSAQRITDDEQRATLRDAGMGEVAVEGIVGMAAGKREGFTPGTAALGLMITPSSLASGATTHLQPEL
jgi:hypothetical protein